MQSGDLSKSPPKKTTKISSSGKNSSFGGWSRRHHTQLRSFLSPNSVLRKVTRKSLWISQHAPCLYLHFQNSTVSPKYNPSITVRILSRKLKGKKIQWRGWGVGIKASWKATSLFPPAAVQLFCTMLTNVLTQLAAGPSGKSLPYLRHQFSCIASLQGSAFTPCCSNLFASVLFQCSINVTDK